MNHIFFVRHGENHANITKEFSYKKVDYSLTKKGLLQARQTASCLRDKSIAAIYSSPMRRAVETAEIIANELSLEVTVIENFRELNVGALDGQSGIGAWGFYHMIISDWLDNGPEVTFPSGENFHEFSRRFRSGFISILEKHSDQKLVVVGHGGALTMIMKDFCPHVDIRELMNLQSHNCSITELLMEVRHQSVSCELKKWSDALHLSGEAANLISGVPV